MSRTEDPAARAERILGELRGATAEAAGVLKDLRAATKEARTQVDQYLVDQVADTIAAVHRDLRARATRYLMDMLGQIENRALQAIASAEETIATASTIDVLLSYTADALCRNTIYVDGMPVVKFGTTISPDDEDHI